MKVNLIPETEFTPERLAELKAIINYKRTVAGMQTYPKYRLIFRGRGKNAREPIELTEKEARYVAPHLRIWLDGFITKE